MPEIYHTIRANLYNNPLTEDPNDLIARVDSERSLSVADICSTAVSRGGAGTTTTMEAMEHNTNLFLKEMAYQLCDGFAVNTGYFTANAQIKGVFDGPDDNFDATRHQIYFLFNQGEDMRSEINETTVEVVGLAEVGSIIQKVTDIRSGSVNDQLTPNRNLRIAGQKIKITGDDPSNGIYFINVDTGDRTKVDPLDYVNNNPSELIIVTPDLPDGSYQLEIVTQFTRTRNLKAPRISTFDKILTVGAVQ